MNFKKINFFKLFTSIMFIFYLFLLIKVIVLKGNNPFELSHTNINLSLQEKLSLVNFVPFKTILEFLKVEHGTKISLVNLLGNIIPFIPLGLFIALLFKKCRKYNRIFFISLIISLLIEISQLIFRLGSCDIDDIILNVFSSMFGLYIYLFVEKHILIKKINN